jgi:hypothetical protein
VQRTKWVAAASGRSSGEKFPSFALETVTSFNKEADVGERPELGGSKHCPKLTIEGRSSSARSRSRTTDFLLPESSEKKYLIDYDFYFGLARRDVEKAQVALRQLVAPNSLRARSNDESGYTLDLISTPAVIYAKIAWRHGF